MFAMLPFWLKQFSSIYVCLPGHHFSPTKSTMDHVVKYIVEKCFDNLIDAHGRVDASPKEAKDLFVEFLRKHLVFQKNSALIFQCNSLRFLAK